MRRAVLIAGWLAAAGCGPRGQDALTQPQVPASPVRFHDAHEAARALMPNYVRTIPLSTFGSTAGLAVGVRIAARTQTGKLLIGTVTAIGKDSVTMRVESWQ